MITKPDWQFAPQTVQQRGRKIIMIAHIGLILALLDIVIVAAAPLARMYLNVQPFTAFRIFFLGIQFGLLLAAAGILLTVIAIFMKVTPAWKRGLLMLLLGTLPLITVITVIGPDRFKSPMIHDISTDTDNPPEFSQAKSLRTSAENSLEYGGPDIATQQHSAYPDIKPVITGLNRDEAFNRAIQIATDLDWNIINVDHDAGIIEAYDTTKIFAFADDVVIRVRADISGSRIDIRSASRVGVGDIGKNAARIEDFIQAFKQ